jgi:hypothetical protein
MLSHRERGAALLLALGLAVAAALLALASVSKARSVSGDAEAAIEGVRSEAAIRSALALTVATLADGTRLTLGPTPLELAYQLDGFALKVLVQAESGLVSVNHAPPELLARLAGLAGFDRASVARLQAALADRRRVAVPAALPRDTGADVDPDRALPSASTFVHPAELRTYLAADAAARARLESWLTAWTELARPEPALAPPAVRAALGGGAPRAAPPDRDPAATYRLRIEAERPGRLRRVREIVLRLEPSSPTGFVVLDWSPPLAARPGQPWPHTPAGKS